MRMVSVCGVVFLLIAFVAVNFSPSQQQAEREYPAEFRLLFKPGQKIQVSSPGNGRDAFEIVLDYPGNDEILSVSTDYLTYTNTNTPQDPSKHPTVVHTYALPFRSINRVRFYPAATKMK